MDDWQENKTKEDCLNWSGWQSYILLTSFLLAIQFTSYPVFQSSPLFLDSPRAPMPLSYVWFSLHLSASCFEGGLTHHSFIRWIFWFLRSHFPGSRSAWTWLKTWIRSSTCCILTSVQLNLHMANLNLNRIIMKSVWLSVKSWDSIVQFLEAHLCPKFNFSCTVYLK